jgi:hypothetical protein
VIWIEAAGYLRAGHVNIRRKLNDRERQSAGGRRPDPTRTKFDDHVRAGRNETGEPVEALPASDDPYQGKELRVNPCTTERSQSRWRLFSHERLGMARTMSAKQAKVTTRLATPTKLPPLWSEAEGGLYMPPDPSVPLLVVVLVPAALRKQIEKQSQRDEEKKKTKKSFSSPRECTI